MVEQAREVQARKVQARKVMVKARKAGAVPASAGEASHVGEDGSPPIPPKAPPSGKDPSAKAAAAGKVSVAARKKDAVAAKSDANGDIQLGYLSDSLGFHLRLAQDASYRTFAKHRDKDLIKPGRYPALAIIHLNPGISQSALGRAIARDKSTVSPLIKDLQKNGFINRQASTQDRRSVTLSLTRKGERTLDRLHARATEHEGELDRLVGTSKARLMALLDKIITSMSP